MHNFNARKTTWWGFSYQFKVGLSTAVFYYLNFWWETLSVPASARICLLIYYHRAPLRNCLENSSFGNVISILMSLTKLFVEASEVLSTGELFIIHKLLQVRKNWHSFYGNEILPQVMTLAEWAICVKSDPNVATLYLKAFKYHLKLGHYEETYNVMIKNLDPSSRKDCLNQLLIVLCDWKQLETLIQFP